MGCNVSKEHQADAIESGGDDASKSDLNKSKKNDCKNSGQQQETNKCVANSNVIQNAAAKEENHVDKDQINSAEDAEEDMNIDPKDPELNAAAAKIQASFRGHRVRKELKKTADEIDLEPSPRREDKLCEEEGEINLEDPEVQKAATKIQASFRGYMVRKQGGKDDNSPTSDNPDS